MMREVLRHPLRFVGDHRFTRAQASNYLDEDLDADGRERVEQHSHVCPPCMRLLAGLRRTLSALSTLRDLDSPTGHGDHRVSDGVLARLRDEPDRVASCEPGDNS